MKQIKMVRLIADEGKILINGSVYGTVVDVFENEVENWQEVDEITVNTMEENDGEII